MAACVISMSTVVHCRLTCDLGTDQNSSTTLPVFELLLFQALVCFHVVYLSDTTAIHAQLLPSAGICLRALVAACPYPERLSGGQVGPQSCPAHMHWSHVDVSAVFKATTSHLGEINPRSVSNL